MLSAALRSVLLPGRQDPSYPEQHCYHLSPVPAPPTQPASSTPGPKTSRRQRCLAGPRGPGGEGLAAGTGGPQAWNGASGQKDNWGGRGVTCAVHGPPFRTGGRVPGVRMEARTGGRPRAEGPHH